MRLNQSSILSPNDLLVINGRLIQKVWIELSCKEFAKVNSILRSPMVKLNFKIHLFKAACISILLYGCQTWLPTKALIDKLHIYARTCYLIMLGIVQFRNHVKNQNLCNCTDQVPLSECLFALLLEFTSHCIR